MQQPVQRAKVLNVQNQHQNHDISQQKPAIQQQNQIKQQWNHTGQATNPQMEERQVESKSSDWAANNQLSQHQVSSNFHAGQEMFGQIQQGHVQSSQVQMSYASGQQLPQHTQVAQMNVAKSSNQLPGRF